MELHTNSSNNTIFADADGESPIFTEFHSETRYQFELDEAGRRE